MLYNELEQGDILSKSAHTRFVHSRGECGVCLKSHVLDSSRDLGGLIQRGEVVLPRAVVTPRRLSVLPHIAHTVPFGVPGPFVVPIATRPRQGIGPRTGRRPPAQRPKRRACPPRRH